MGLESRTSRRPGLVRGLIRPFSSLRHFYVIITCENFFFLNKKNLHTWVSKKKNIKKKEEKNFAQVGFESRISRPPGLVQGRIRSFSSLRNFYVIIGCEKIFLKMFKIAQVRFEPSTSPPAGLVGGRKIPFS